MNRTQDNISFYNRFFKTNVHPKCMIINSTYTVYKRGTKTTRESRACLPVTGTFTFFFSFFFSCRMPYGQLWRTPQTASHQISASRYLTRDQFCPFSSLFVWSLQFMRQVSTPAIKLKSAQSSLKLPASRKLTLIVLVRSEQRSLRNIWSKTQQARRDIAALVQRHHCS